MGQSPFKIVAMKQNTPLDRAIRLFGLVRLPLGSLLDSVSHGLGHLTCLGGDHPLVLLAILYSSCILNTKLSALILKHFTLPLLGSQFFVFVCLCYLILSSWALT